jgi:hypothetical protein
LPSLCCLNDEWEEFALGFAELGAEPTEPAEASPSANMAVAMDDGVVFKHRLHKALGMANEDEGVLMQMLSGEEPKIGAVAH